MYRKLASQVFIFCILYRVTSSFVVYFYIQINFSLTMDIMFSEIN